MSEQGSGVAAEKPPPKNWSKKETGIYLHIPTGTYYERPKIAGVYVYRSLGTKNLKAARLEKSNREQARAKGEDPQPKQLPGITVGEVLRKYAVDNYPDRHRKERPNAMRKSEEVNCRNLLRYWEKIRVEDITVAENDRYHDWRVKDLQEKQKAKAQEIAEKRVREKEAAIEKAKTKKNEKSKAKALNVIEARYADKGLLLDEGHRTVDLELNTFRNALLWSARCEVIKHVPPPMVWKRYQESGAVEHCRDFRPNDAEELHKMARLMFVGGSSRAGGRSEVIGWQILFESCTGLRTEEVLGLRTDAKPNEPGWITDDGKSLCVRRVKDPEKADINPFVMVREDFQMILSAFHKWHAKKHPDSQWYFPSPRPQKRKKPAVDLESGESGEQPKLGKALNESGIIHAMRRISVILGRKLTSHGLRAFYVTVRRSWGIPDIQIGFEIGHRPGQTLAEVYGGCPPHWLSGDGPKMKWLPEEGEPAWSVLGLK